MAIFDLFSKRQKKSREEANGVYCYDTMPIKLRVQIVHILNDALGNHDQYSDGCRREAYKTYKSIVDILCREYGLFNLPGVDSYDTHDYYKQLTTFILNQKAINNVIDAIEIAFVAIDEITRDVNYLYRTNASKIADAAISELNERFKENGVGYKYENGNIIRIDSEVMHAEVVKPTLVLLHNKEYRGAEDEFIGAHKHYRNGQTKEVLSDCLKAFESVMKIICNKRRWKYPPNATSNALINICFENKLMPEFWLQHFTSLRSILESGIPSARNKLSGHGQGTDVVEVPMYIASFVLHMTASVILFLTEADKNLK